MKLLYGTALKRFLKKYRRANRPKRSVKCLLQSVEYPVNVGSSFRMADGAGVDELILTGITPTPPNPTIDKIGRNKHTKLSWRYEKDAVDAIQQLKAEGYQIVAVELTDSAVPYHEFEFADKVCLVVGNEDHGVTNATLEHCDAAIFLPMYGKGLSLNVHVALSIVTYQALHAV
ncbi:MAG: TrmH family RNA methyltransferase [Candidatus Promineifilaceae bacterium]